MRFLASLGHPGDEQRGSVVLGQNEQSGKFYELLTGEEVSSKELTGFLEQAERYVLNLKQALGLSSQEELTYQLVARWTEPENGHADWTVQLTASEAERIRTLIGWLKQHATDEWGHTLAAWRLERTDQDGLDMTSIEEVLDEIALQSRYNETGVPGDFYGATHPDLDGR